MVLFSWRRIGKTALLKCFLEDILKESGSETLYVDLLGTRDISTALKKFTQAIYESYGETASGISASFKNLLSKTGVELSFDPITGVPKFSIGIRESGNAEKSLKAIGAFLSNRKKKIIVIIDEFQQVSSYPEKDREAVFRSWVQAYLGIRFFFSWNHRNMMLSMFTEKNRPFYRSVQLMQLDPIELKSNRDFARHYFVSNKKSFDDKAFEDIIYMGPKADLLYTIGLQ